MTDIDITKLAQDLAASRRTIVAETGPVRTLNDSPAVGAGRWSAAKLLVRCEIDGEPDVRLLAEVLGDALVVRANVQNAYGPVELAVRDGQFVLQMCMYGAHDEVVCVRVSNAFAQAWLEEFAPDCKVRRRDEDDPMDVGIVPMEGA